jgi:hypothetical protein
VKARWCRFACARAIRCYEKAGFRRVGTVDTPDGPAVYMLCERREFGAADAAPGAGTGA